MIPLRVDILRTRAAICNGFLILVNVLVFLFELTLSPKAGQAFVYTFGLIPSHEQLLFAMARHHVRAGVPPHVHQHVPARRLDAPAREHAVPLGFRR